MRRPPWSLCLVVLALPAGGCGGQDERVLADPRAEVLSFVPPRATVVVLARTDVDRGRTRATVEALRRWSGARLALAPLDGLLARAGLRGSTEVRPQLRHPVAVAFGDARSLGGPPLVAWATREGGWLRERMDGARQDGRLLEGGRHRGFVLYRPPDGSWAYARRGQLLLAGAGADVLRRAIDRRARRRGMTVDGFAQRVRGLPPDAPVRAAVDARALIASGAAGQVRQAAWPAALRGAAVGLDSLGGRLRLLGRVSSDRRAVAPADLPVAPGAEAPPVAAAGGVRVGLRDPAHTVRFAERAGRALDPEAFDRFDTGSRPLRLGTGVDVRRDVVARLTGPLLLSADPGRWSARVGVTDPRELGGALGRLRRIGGPLLGVAGASGLRLAEGEDDETVLTRDGRAVATFGVRDGALAAGSGDADLGTVARLRGTPARGARGGLGLHVEPATLQALAVDVFGLPPIASLGLRGLGAADVAVHAERDRTTATVTLGGER